MKKVAKEVELGSNKIEDHDENIKKRKIEERPEMGINCEECDTLISNKRSLKIHKIKNHTKTTSIRKKSKYLPLEVVKDLKQIQKTLDQMNSNKIQNKPECIDAKETLTISVKETNGKPDAKDE